MDAAEIVHEFPSATQTFVAAQIEGLIEAGCSVSVFADGPGKSMEPLDDEHRVANRIRYYGLPLKNLRESIGDWQNLLGNGSGNDKPGSLGPNPGRPGVTTKLRLIFESRAFRPPRSYDVIHAHFGPNGMRAIGLRKLGVIGGPVLTSFYGYDVGRYRVSAGFASLFEKGERFIALSEHMRKSLTTLGCPSDRLIVHRLGVDPDRFTAPARASGTKLELISIARLVEKKGIEHGLRAVAELVRRGVDAGYTIVGDGPLRSRLQRAARDLGIEKRARFIGTQTPRAIPDLLRASDVLLAPSVTARDGDAEGTPVAILEAQAAGLPVVSTLHAGIPEIVEDAVSGFLVPEGDESALADRLAELSRSPSLRATMGIAGRAIVMGRHDIRALNRDLLEIYRSVRNA